MSRTPEQGAADIALADAIRAVIRAYNPDAEPAVLVDYVVVAAQLNDDDSHSVVSVESGPASPVWTQLGLLEVGAAQLRGSVFGETGD
ncbi:hypothetical protein [Nocardia carnea]|uniref:hypothetical protein n=1 Tax=Nocardia carnea TaxID=37328 RepID=UPI0024541CB8|nr:hypothetical protein [Nocardia carnea]